MRPRDVIGKYGLAIMEIPTEWY